MAMTARERAKAAFHRGREVETNILEAVKSANLTEKAKNAFLNFLSQTDMSAQGAAGLLHDLIKREGTYQHGTVRHLITEDQKERAAQAEESRKADKSPEHRKAPPKRTKPTPSRRFEGRDYTPRRPQMMKGGMYKGKMHSYVGGGMVRDLETLRRK